MQRSVARRVGVEVGMWSRRRWRTAASMALLALMACVKGAERSPLASGAPPYAGCIRLACAAAPSPPPPPLPSVCSAGG